LKIKERCVQKLEEGGEGEGEDVWRTTKVDQKEVLVSRKRPKWTKKGREQQKSSDVFSRRLGTHFPFITDSFRANCMR